MRSQLPVQHMHRAVNIGSCTSRHGDSPSGLLHLGHDRLLVRTFEWALHRRSHLGFLRFKRPTPACTLSAMTVSHQICTAHQAVYMPRRLPVHSSLRNQHAWVTCPWGVWGHSACLGVATPDTLVCVLSTGLSHHFTFESRVAFVDCM